MTNLERSFCLIEVYNTEEGDILYRTIVDVEKMESEVLVKKNDWSSEFEHSELYDNFFHASIHHSRQSASEWFDVAKKLKYEDRELRYVIKKFDKMYDLIRDNLRKNTTLYEHSNSQMSELTGNINSAFKKIGRKEVNRVDLCRAHPGTRIEEIYTSWKKELDARMDRVSETLSVALSCETDYLRGLSETFYESLFEDTFLNIERNIQSVAKSMFGSGNTVADQPDQAPLKIPEELVTVILDLDFMETTLEYQESLIAKMSDIRSSVERRQSDNREEYARNVPVTSWVYLTYAESGELLYVGKTRSLFHRLKDHSLGSAWFSLMDRMAAIPFSTDSEALINETALIKKLHPRFNIVHNSGRV